MRAIVVRIRSDGSVEAETKGLKGAECLPWIGELERLTDAVTVDSRYTREFYEHAGQATAQEVADVLEQGLEQR